LRGPWDVQQEGKNRRTTDMAGGFYVETTADLGAQGTKFRPYSIITLIFFYIGKFFGLLFRRRR
jgi:hypothetical protein